MRILCQICPRRLSVAIVTTLAIQYPDLHTRFSGSTEVGLHAAELLQPLLRLVNVERWTVNPQHRLLGAYVLFLYFFLDPVYFPARPCLTVGIKMRVVAA